MDDVSDIMIPTQKNKYRVKDMTAAKMSANRCIYVCGMYMYIYMPVSHMCVRIL